MKLLIIDDEKSAINRVVSNFAKENWTIEFATSYDDADKVLMTKKFDIIICDYHLGVDSSENGVNLIKKARNNGIKTPVILLTGKDFNEITPWRALEAGFDDFIRKPFEPKELKARVLAILRREVFKSDGEIVSNSIKFKNLEIDYSKRILLIDGKEVKIGNTLFLILYKIMLNKGELVTYEYLIEYIWGEPALYISQYTKTLRVHMSHMRDLLGLNFTSNIKTIHGIGYILGEEKGVKENNGKNGKPSRNNK